MSNLTKWQSWFKGKSIDPSYQWTELDALVAWGAPVPILENRATSQTPWFSWETYAWIYYPSNTPGVRHYRYDILQTVSTKTIKLVQEATHKFTDDTYEERFKNIPMDALLPVLLFGMHASPFESTTLYFNEVTKTLQSLNVLHQPNVQIALLMQSKPWQNTIDTRALLNAICTKTTLTLEAMALYFSCRSMVMPTWNGLTFNMLNALHEKYPNETIETYRNQFVDLTLAENTHDLLLANIYRYSLIDATKSNIATIIKKPFATVHYWKEFHHRSLSYEYALNVILNDSALTYAFVNNLATSLQVPAETFAQHYTNTLAVLESTLESLQHTILLSSNTPAIPSVTLPTL